MPGSYIEFAGRGGYNALRHVIDSHFSSTEDDHNVMLFRLWNTSNTDANETPLDNAVYMKLRGNRKIETVNTQPYTTDSYVLGEGELSWAEIFSIISKSDKNTSARLKLWNGR